MTLLNRAGAMYPHYDLCVWSQTNWRHIQHKLQGMGILGLGANAVRSLPYFITTISRAGAGARLQSNNDLLQRVECVEGSTLVCGGFSHSNLHDGLYHFPWLQNTDFNITLVLDQSSMFKIKSPYKKNGKTWEHEVKPLELIWRKFPDHYNQSNTIHVDDLRSHPTTTRPCCIFLVLLALCLVPGMSDFIHPLTISIACAHATVATSP
jgi:hypothetical protein